ncbi:MAG: hypothetical protein PVF65_12580 [Sphingomonadales bacterium]|jgi:hypothetical protein
MDRLESEQENAQRAQTVGQLALDQSQKDIKADVVEIEREVHKGNKSEDSWEAQMTTALERGKAKYAGEFFIVILNKKERLLQNVIRRYFLDRRTCPLPEYDQTVFRYDPKDDMLEYIWTVPDWQAAEDLKANRFNLSKELVALLEMVDKFEDGTLAKECSRINQRSAQDWTNGES